MARRRYDVERRYGECQIRVASGDTRSVTTWNLEDYTVGALAAEASLDWPEEALLAQAIACRSYGMLRVVHSSRSDHDVVASTLHQAFVSPRVVPDQFTEFARRTAGHHLVDRSLIRAALTSYQALFHMACGGQTDSARSVWGAQPDDSPVARCDSCERRAPRWRVTLTSDELASLAPGDDLGDLTRVEVSAAAPSGRAGRVTLVGDRAAVTLAAEDMRSAIGYTRLPSTWFTSVDTDPAGNVSIEGIGHGHGVGLCMSGAQALAADGADHREILERYYPDARLRVASG